MSEFSPFLIWVGSSWQLKDCEGNNRLAHASNWLAENAYRFPFPKRMPGEIVDFMFSKTKMRGQILYVEYYERDDSYSWEEPRWMSYTINGNGHSRWVFEKDLL